MSILMHLDSWQLAAHWMMMVPFSKKIMPQLYSDFVSCIYTDGGYLHFACRRFFPADLLSTYGDHWFYRLGLPLDPEWRGAPGTILCKNHGLHALLERVPLLPLGLQPDYVHDSQQGVFFYNHREVDKDSSSSSSTSIHVGWCSSQSYYSK